MALANYLAKLNSPNALKADPATVLSDVTKLMDDLQVAYGPNYTPNKVSIKVSNYPFKPNTTGPEINVAALVKAVTGIPANNFNGVIDLCIAPAPLPTSSNTPTGSNPNPNVPMVLPLNFDDGSKFLFPTARGSANCATLNVSFDYSNMGSGANQTPDAAKRQWDFQLQLNYGNGQVKTLWNPYNSGTPTNSLNNKLVGFRCGLSFQHATSVSQYYNTSVTPAYVQNVTNDAYAVAGSIDNLWVSASNPQNAPASASAPSPPYNAGQLWQAPPFNDFLTAGSIKFAANY